MVNRQYTTSVHRCGRCSGYGAVFQSKWCYGAWSVEFQAHQITFKELFSIALAIDTWGLQLSNKCIILHSDNSAVVHTINEQTSKDFNIMLLVRKMVLSCMKQNLSVKSAHIPGKTIVYPTFFHIYR